MQGEGQGYRRRKKGERTGEMQLTEEGRRMG
jgi:hypothetical protein